MQAGGRTFTNGFTSSPICCPARSSIFTGRYVHNHCVLTNHDSSLLDHRTTIQRYLGDAGYENAIVGKFLNEWPLGEAPPYFDRWSICSPCSEGGYFGRDLRRRRHGPDGRRLRHGLHGGPVGRVPPRLRGRRRPAVVPLRRDRRPARPLHGRASVPRRPRARVERQPGGLRVRSLG
jgi:arylsulfatase A-like enzyme